MPYALFMFLTGMATGVFLFSLLLVAYRDRWWSIK